MTWREYIAGARHERRRVVYRHAIRTGFTYRQIAEATGHSTSTIHEITGKVDRSVSLDEEMAAVYGVRGA